MTCKLCARGLLILSIVSYQTLSFFNSGGEREWICSPLWKKNWPLCKIWSNSSSVHGRLRRQLFRAFQKCIYWNCSSCCQPRLTFYCFLKGITTDPYRVKFLVLLHGSVLSLRAKHCPKANHCWHCIGIYTHSSLLVTLFPFVGLDKKTAASNVTRQWDV